MRKKSYKGRCEKRTLSKSKGIVRAYDAIQSVYANILENDEGVVEIQCNVLLEGIKEGEYTSDFVCVKTNGDTLVRECLQRKYLAKPMSLKLLDVSREYWLQHGVTDWGVVIDEEK